MGDVSKSLHLPDCPYPGIEPFSYSFRKVFFAREKETRVLMRLIVMYRGVLLYSESGTGKSSVVNAGLVPLALQEGYNPERIRIQPRKEEEIIVERISKGVAGEQRFLTSIFTPDQEEHRMVFSVENFVQILRQKARVVRPLLIFDQFEEWVTLFEQDFSAQVSRDARTCKKKILSTLVELINDTELRVKVLIVLREDYLAKLAPLFEQCPNLPDQYLRLTHLTGDQVYRAIRGPFEEYPKRYQTVLGHSLASSIQKQFEERTGGAGISLTEVQIVCDSLFNSGKTGLELEELFNEHGGVKYILEQYLESALGKLNQNQRETAVGLLSCMLTSAGTRNVISEDDLTARVAHEDNVSPALVRETLKNLEKRTKLIHREPRREVYYYEIASEFLVEWIRDKKQERQRLSARRKIEEKTREARRFRWLSIIIGVVAVLAVALGTWGYIGHRKARRAQFEAESAYVLVEINLENLDRAYSWLDTMHNNLQDAYEELIESEGLIEEKTAELITERQLSLSRKLATDAESNLSVDPELSMLLALHAVSISRFTSETIEPEAVHALHHCLHSSRIVRTLTGHTGPIDDVAFGLDGESVITASYDGTAKVWDVSTGVELITLVGHKGAVYSVAYSMDSIHIVTGSADGTAKVWDATTGVELLTFTGHTAPIDDAAFSPDGRNVVTVSYDGTAKVWDATTGVELLTFTGHNDVIYAVAFSPDGSRVATASRDGTAKVWDVSNGIELLTLTGHTSDIYAVAFSPDGSRVATASRDCTAKVWDVSNGTELLILAGHSNTVFDVSFSPDDKYIATASFDKTVRVWDASSGRHVFTLSGHKTWVFGVTFSPDSEHIATADRDGTAKLWKTTSPTTAVLTLTDHKKEVYSVAYSMDSIHIVTGSADGTAKVWDATTGVELLTFTGHTAPIDDAAFSPDGRNVVTVSYDGTAKVWDATTGVELLTFTGHNDVIYAVAFSPDGSRVATASRDSTAKVWDVSNGIELLTLTGHNSAVLDVSFSPDGKYIATASFDKTARVWDATSGVDVSVISDFISWVWGIEFSPDGKYVVTADRDGTAKMWDLKSEKRVLPLFRHKSGLRCVAFSPGGERLVACSIDGTIKVWDVFSGQELVTISEFAEGITDVAFSPDGKQLATAREDGTVCVYAVDVVNLTMLALTRVTRSLTPEEFQFYLGADQHPQTAIGLILDGKKLAIAGDVNGAVGNFERARKINPTFDVNPEGDARKLAAASLVAKGRNRAKAGAVDEAVKNFQGALELYAALDLDPDSVARNLAAAALVTKGRWCAERNKEKQAVIHLEKAIFLNPQCAQAYLELGITQVRVGNYHSAIEAFQKVNEIVPSERAYSELGILYHEILFEYEQAYDCYRKALEINPDDVDYIANYAEVNFTTRRFEEAYGLAQEALFEYEASYPSSLSSQLAMRFIIFSSLLLRGNIVEADVELDEFMSCYKKVTYDYENVWVYTGARHFVAQRRMPENHKEIVLKLLDILETPTPGFEIKQFKDLL